MAGRAGVPTLGPRRAAAFLRDPAAFVAGPGLEVGDRYRVRLPGLRLLVVTDPGAAEDVLVRRADAFAKSRVYWRALRRLMGDSLGTLEGGGWAWLHRVEHPFFTPRAVEGYLREVAVRTTRHLDALAGRVDGGRDVAVLDALSELNARVVLSVLFGREDEPAAREVAARVADGHGIVHRLMRRPWRAATLALTRDGRRARAHRAFFDRYAAGLGRGPGGSGPGGLLRALVDAGGDPEAPARGASLVRNELLFHLGASVETQAAAEGWALWLLERHPEVLARVRAEADAPAPDRTGDHEALDDLVFTRQVVMETLRLYPPVHAVLRDCVAPVDLGRTRVGRGETLLVALHGLHRNPRLWEAPGTFRPSRFAPDRPPPGRYAYLPFGAGRHVCIGRHLALPAMVLAVAQLARRFDWAFGGADVRPDPRPSLKPGAPFVATFSVRVPAGPAAGGGP